MKKSTMYAVIAVALLLLVGTVGYALTRDNDDTTAPKTTATTTKTEQTTKTNAVAPVEPAPSVASSSATMITFSDSGFSPAALTVKAGSTVTVKNTSSHSVQLSSNDHPTHMLNPELNMNTIISGGTGNITVTKVGTWGYHDHIDSTKTGTINVQ